MIDVPKYQQNYHSGICRISATRAVKNRQPRTLVGILYWLKGQILWDYTKALIWPVGHSLTPMAYQHTQSFSNTLVFFWTFPTPKPAIPHFSFLSSLPPSLPPTTPRPHPHSNQPMFFYPWPLTLSPLPQFPSALPLPHAYLHVLLIRINFPTPPTPRQCSPCSAFPPPWHHPSGPAPKKNKVLCLFAQLKPWRKRCVGARRISHPVNNTPSECLELYITRISSSRPVVSNSPSLTFFQAPGLRHRDAHTDKRYM